MKGVICEDGGDMHKKGHVFYRNLHRSYPLVDRGEGVYLYDSQGRRYLDGSGGSLVVSIGHGVKEVAEAALSQMEKVSFAHTSQFTSAPQEELAEALAKLAPGDLNRVIFVSGGSEATESAIKLARQYHLERGKTKKYKIIGRWRSFHGATLGALSAGGQTVRRAPFNPLLLDFPHIPPAYCYRCPYGRPYPGCDLECAWELERAVIGEGVETISAFIAEPIVGAAAGALVPPPEYFRIIREVCDRYDILFIADEVMTGMGRTGMPFAIEQWGVTPDMIITGKGISSGYAPLGAVIVSDRICRVIEGGSGAFIHGHTYMGHPLSCAIGLAVLRYLEDHRLIERAKRMGEALMAELEQLKGHPLVGDVRGKGLMAALELVVDKASKTPFPRDLRVAEAVAGQAFQKGLILYPGSGGADGLNGDHILIGPPFIISEPEIKEMVRTLGEALDEIEKGLRDKSDPSKIYPSTHLLPIGEKVG